MYTDIISVKRDLISVKRDLISVKRDPLGVKRDLTTMKTQENLEIVLVKRDLISVKKSCKTIFAFLEIVLQLLILASNKQEKFIYTGIYCLLT